MAALCDTLRNYLNKESVYRFMRRCIFHVLSVGPLPNHIAFIMDGNRRYARNRKLGEGAGHRNGFLALMSMLRYCFEMNVKYITIYAFSIDNFKRSPQEVESVMNLMEEAIESMLEKDSLVNTGEIRLYFVGNLQLLRESSRLAAEKAMAATAKYNKAFLLICVAYTSTDEMTHAVQEACNERQTEVQNLNSEKVYNDSYGEEKNDTKIPIKLVDIERHMYTAMAPEPDILIRTSGEARLSNFLLWQTSYSYLYSPSALWPEISFRHMLWGVLNYQRAQPYLDKKKKQL